MKSQRRASADFPMARRDGIRSWAGLVESERRRYPVRDRVALDVEPLAAAIRVAPALDAPALHIVTKEKIFAPGLVPRLQRRSCHPGRAAVHEFPLVALA